MIREEHVIRIRKGTLHLTVHNAVQRDRIVLFLKMVTPAFLPERQLILINIRVKHRIHVNIHKVAKILIVTARYRINRLIGERQRVQICMQRTF